MDPTLKPMLCNGVDVPPAGDEWIAEGKYDGFRVIAHRGFDAVTVYAGRNSADYSGHLPYIEEQLLALLPPDTAIDGELMSRTRGEVQSVMFSGGAHRPVRAEHRLYLVMFDVLRIAGVDARTNQWHERRGVLDALDLTDTPNLQLSPIVPSGPEALAKALELGLEGLVCKRRDSRYVNTRSGLWVKVKPQKLVDARITGFKPGKKGGKFDGMVGAFEVEILRTEGEQLVPTGATTTVKCGDDARHEDATNHPERWQGVVVELKHHGIQPSGVPLHPQFHRRRDDAAPVTKPKVAPKAAPVVRTGGASGRNYGAMKPAKLEGCIAELEARSGDAYERVMAKGADVEADLAIARAALSAKVPA